MTNPLRISMAKYNKHGNPEVAFEQRVSSLEFISLNVNEGELSIYLHPRSDGSVEIIVEVVFGDEAKGTQGSWVGRSITTDPEFTSLTVSEERHYLPGKEE